MKFNYELIIILSSKKVIPFQKANTILLYLFVLSKNTIINARYSERNFAQRTLNSRTCFNENRVITKVWLGVAYEDPKRRIEGAICNLN